MQRAPRPTPRLAMLVSLCALTSACEPMESRGDPFVPAPAPVAPVAAAPGTDPAFNFPADPPLVIGSEQLANGDQASMAAAAGVDPAAVLAADPVPSADVPVETPAPAPPAPPPVGVPAAVQWPVRLVSTLPQAQPPRAILGLASGEERVVSPGSILAAEGLVVMSVTADRVQLAKVEPAGDHATIATVELTAQYPTGR